MGAEFIGAVEAVEVMGAGLTFNRNLADVWRNGLHQSRDDWQETISGLTSGPMLKPVIEGHIQRRQVHTAEFLGGLTGLILTAQSHFLEEALSLWQPFLGVVKQDLS